MSLIQKLSSLLSSMEIVDLSSLLYTNMLQKNKA